jgi:polyisoprenoid-binding protein YceI
MKRTLLLFALGAAVFASCQSDPKADAAKTGEAVQIETAAGKTYQADLAQSRVEWTGTKPVGQHHGSFALQDGSLTVNDGAISGGRFMMDMNSLKVEDKDTNGVFKLGGHLRSADFFDVTEHPTAMFEISSVAPGVTASGDGLVMKDATHTVTGNLTMKGVTKSISFPAKISVNDQVVTANANFNIDRTNWGLVYGSDQSLGDKFIRPTVNIGLHLVANM